MNVGPSYVLFVDRLDSLLRYRTVQYTSDEDDRYTVKEKLQKITDRRNSL